MILKESKGDLFRLDEKYALAHCISLDCKMGAGIAVQFDKRFKGMKSYLKRCVAENNLKDPCVIPYSDNDRLIFNLITKEKYWHKPTYRTIEATIEDMAFMCKTYNIKYLAIPYIGCGMDKLQWGKVKPLIEKHFNDLDVEIQVKYI